MLGNPSREWLAEPSGHVAPTAAEAVWKGLGVPERFGVSRVGGHQHCQLPDRQRPDVTAFVERFLLRDESATTDVSKSPYEADLARWRPWSVPQRGTLSSED